MVAQNVEQVQYLKSIVTENRLLELTAPALLNLLYFRCKGNLNDEEKLNALNKELLFQLHESFVAPPSYTILKGKYSLRVANCNHITVIDDFKILADDC
jgi:aromatic-L-amino-acid decarboxylase